MLELSPAITSQGKKLPALRGTNLEKIKWGQVLFFAFCLYSYKRNFTNALHYCGQPRSFYKQADKHDNIILKTRDIYLVFILAMKF